MKLVKLAKAQGMQRQELQKKQMTERVSQFSAPGDMKGQSFFIAIMALAIRRSMLFGSLLTGLAV